MPIDPSIPLQAKNVQLESPVNQLTMMNEALKYGEMNRAIGEQNQLNEYLKSGADLASAEGKRGLLNYGKTGIAHAKAIGDIEKSGLETKKLQNDTKLQGLEFAYQGARNMVANPTNENIIAWGQDSVMNGYASADHVNSQVKQILAMPVDQRRAYLGSLGAKAKDMIDQYMISASQQQTANVAMRGQNISAATAQRGQDIGRIPVGYRMGADGNLEAIPGGPTTTPLAPKELQTREAKYPMATQAVKTVEAKSDKLIADIETLKNHPGLDSITGTVYGRTPSVTAEGRQAQALYDSIVARGGFQELAAMRAASPTGGALGNVSNQEGQQLKDAFGTLNRTQDASSLRTQLGRVADDVRGAKQRVREAYDMTYDYKAGAPSATPAPGGKDDPLGIR